jgi:FemAB-related protein (PEP-CTERM system-associated)
MDVILLSEDRLEQWECYLKTSPHATFAHELGWRKVVEKTYHHTPYYLMAIEGNSVEGLLPLVLIRSRIFGRFLATAPYLSYGGLLAQEEDGIRALVGAAKELAREKEASYLEIRGLNTVGHGLRLKEKYCTYLLPLDPDPKAVWARLEKRARTAVRKAMKSGLAVEWGSHLVSDFVEVLCRLMRDHGTPYHGESFYRNIVEAFSGRTEIFMVRYRDGFIGGGFTVTFKETLAWLCGGCLKAYRGLAAMNLLTWEIIRYGCQQGLAYLDFGRSQWDSGTALFKRQWGAQPSPLFYEYYLPAGASLPDQDPTNPKFRLAIALWKRMPVFAAKALGPLIIKDIP